MHHRKLSELSDEDLMVLYQQGQNEAFAQLYSRYEGRVYGYLRQRLPDGQAVSDVFQAAFLKFHRSKDQFDPSFLLAPWLFTVVRSTLLDWQKNRHQQVQKIELQEDHAVVAIPSETAISRQDLHQLPQDQRLAVEMRYFDDLSFQEIARRLETSPANARQLISRGIKSLRQFFTKGGVREK